jgi:hypothetical protein
MSRSHKHTPVSSKTTSASEKSDKKIWHSRMRAKQRDQLAHADEHAEDLLPVAVHEVSNPYSMAKDGRSYQTEAEVVNIAKNAAQRKYRGGESQEVAVEREMAKLRSK